MRKKRLLLWIMAMVPALFALFLLAMVSPLYMLLGAAALLGVLLLLKKRRPEWFRLGASAASPREVTTGDYSFDAQRPKVLMVLTSREDIDTRRIQINKETYIIGRMPDCDFCLKGPRVSRHHLRVEWDEGARRWFAVDLGSTHGTYLNKCRMEPQRRYPLHEGDRIGIDGKLYEVNDAHF